MQHIIKKQVINLVLDKNDDAFSIQHLVSEHYWHEIILVLQKAFDTVSSEEETMYLDKLEIDLGIISVKDIEQGRWGEAVLKKISEQLIAIKTNVSSREKKKIQSKQLSISGQWMFYMQYGYLPWNVLKVNAAWYKYVLEAFASDFVAIDKLRSLIQKHPVAAKRIIFQHDENFITALIETLTAENQKDLPRAIGEIAEVIEFLNQWTEDRVAVQKKQLKQKIWQEVLQFTALEQKNLNPEKLTLYILNVHLPELKTTNKLPRKYLSKNRITAVAFQQIQERLTGKEEQSKQIALIDGEDITEIKKKKPGEKDIKEDKGKKSNAEIKSEMPGNIKDEVIDGSIELSKNTKTSIPGEDSDTGIMDETTGVIEKDKSTDEIIKASKEIITDASRENRDVATSGNIPEDEIKKGAPVNELEEPSEKTTNQPGHELETEYTPKTTNIIKVGEEGIFVQHAGVVLLHPFLNMFFKNLQLVNAGKFIDNVSHQKALYLVHYLAAGNTGPQEHELVIAKVLCAYPLDEPVDSSIELAADELSEADNLLVAAIQKWKILKKTSPLVLRQEFLQRNGKVYTKNDDLYIQVEASPKHIDMLLDHLPWNLSIIILPWMKNIIRVEWR